MSAAGLASYSSLFAAGLDPTGRMPPMDPTGYMYSQGSFADFSSPVNTSRPSEEVRSSSSRRSSLPTFVSIPFDHRYDGAISNGATYSAAKPTYGLSFVPSVLTRSDTTATKRSHYKSFLSLDTNDTFFNSLSPGISNTASRDTSSSRQFVPAAKPSRPAASTNNPTWALPALPSPSPSNFLLPEFSSQAARADPPVSHSNAQRLARRESESQSLHEEPIGPTHSQSRSRDVSSMFEGRIPDLRVGFQSGETSSDIFYSEGRHENVAHDQETNLSPTVALPTRPNYEPRVRSALPSLASPPIIPKRSVQRNMSITSASTFQSATPSLRSAIRRNRRNEALARLEGKDYDPTPYMKESSSFMPFESDDEEEENSEDTDPRTRSLSKSPPPIIKPPSPLRFRNQEPRRFVEIERSDSMLYPIAEAPFGLSSSDTEPSQIQPIPATLTNVPYSLSSTGTEPSHIQPIPETLTNGIYSLTSTSTEPSHIQPIPETLTNGIYSLTSTSTEPSHIQPIPETLTNIPFTLSLSETQSSQIQPIPATLTNASIMHQSIWPSLDTEDMEEEDEEEDMIPNPHVLIRKPSPPRRHEPSPLGSKTNLVYSNVPTPTQSLTSLSSFTPFPAVDIARLRNDSSSNISQSSFPVVITGGSSLHPPKSTRTGSGSGSFVTMGSMSSMSKPGSVDSHNSSLVVVGNDGHIVRRRNGSAPAKPMFSSGHPPSKSKTYPSPYDPSMDLDGTTSKAGWLQASRSQAQKQKSKSKDNKQPDFEYETWLDMGDAKSKDTALQGGKDGASKKRRWLFGK